jgi:predicted transport protein
MDAATETMIRNLEEKTGRGLDEWVGVVRKSGLEKHGEIVKLLKAEHGFTHGYANLVAIAARGGLSAPEGSTEDQEAALFTGRKSGLKPAYDAVRAAIVGLGSEVEASPKKAYVSFRRKKQFALVQPSTATRLDVGLSLKGVEPSGRLESAEGFNAMCTHRVRVESAGAVDAELVAWLRRAYEAAG